MTGLVVVGFITLIVYSAWISHNWVKEKGIAVELGEEVRIARNALLREQQNREVERTSYESRLESKQSEIEALKKYIMARVPGGSDMVGVISGMHEDGKPSSS